MSLLELLPHFPAPRHLQYLCQPTSQGTGTSPAQLHRKHRDPESCLCSPIQQFMAQRQRCQQAPRSRLRHVSKACRSLPLRRLRFLPPSCLVRDPLAPSPALEGCHATHQAPAMMQAPKWIGRLWALPTPGSQITGILMLPSYSLYAGGPDIKCSTDMLAGHDCACARVNSTPAFSCWYCCALRKCCTEMMQLGQQIMTLWLDVQ